MAGSAKILIVIYKISLRHNSEDLKVNPFWVKLKVKLCLHRSEKALKAPGD